MNCNNYLTKNKVIIDEHIKWDKHIDCISTRL